MAKYQGIHDLLQKTLKVNQVWSLCKTILIRNVWLWDWFMLSNINNKGLCKTIIRTRSKKFGVEEWGGKKERPEWWWWWRAQKQNLLSGGGGGGRGSKIFLRDPNGETTRERKNGIARPKWHCLREREKDESERGRKELTRKSPKNRGYEHGC